MIRYASLSLQNNQFKKIIFEDLKINISVQPFIGLFLDLPGDFGHICTKHKGWFYQAPESKHSLVFNISHTTFTLD